MEGTFLEHLTWKEAKDAFDKYSAIAVPLGAVTKEHGPHLPLNTDYLLAKHWAEEVARRFPIIVAPVLGWGYYPAFVNFHGSVSLGPQTFMDLVSDICRSFARNGIERVLLLNTGVSTTGPLRVVVRELNSELPDCLVGLMNLVELGREEIEAELEQPAGSHADEMETSLILSIDEKLVKMERAGEELEATSSLQSIQTSSPLPIENAAGEEVSGIIGDATLASKKKGDSFWDLIFSNLEEIEDFLQGQ